MRREEEVEVEEAYKSLRGRVNMHAVELFMQSNYSPTLCAGLFTL